jgi:hypothetical protein
LGFFLSSLFGNSETIFTKFQSNGLVGFQPSFSVTSQDKRPCSGFLLLFESEFREFGMLALSFSQRVGRESSTIILNDGQKSNPAVFNGVVQMAGLTGQFDQETDFSIIAHNFPCLGLHPFLLCLSDSHLRSCCERLLPVILSNVRMRTSEFERSLVGTKRRLLDGTSSIAGIWARRVSGPKTVIINSGPITVFRALADPVFPFDFPKKFRCLLVLEE